MAVKIGKQELINAHGKPGGAINLAAKYECSVQTVYMKWKKLGLVTQIVYTPQRNRVVNKSPKPAPKPELPIDPNPPSPAMIRLAEFDPVVARALAAKLGKPVVLPNPYVDAPFIGVFGKRVAAMRRGLAGGKSKHD